METKRPAAAARWIRRQLEQGILCERQTGPLAGCLIARIAARRIGRSAERHEGVVAIIAAGQENTNQRLVTGRLGQRVHKTEFINGRGQGRAANGVSGSPQESAAC